MDMEKIIVYTDGGCRGNPGKGAWAYVMELDGARKHGAAGDPLTTNNKMELTAVIKALEDILSHAEWKLRPIEVHTDSQYVKNGITKWIHNWIAKGWKTANKKPVKNQELWKALKEASDQLKVEWHWVRGHSGVELNEVCDLLVNQEMDKL